MSPLLSLIVLNELDWWVSDQWETYTPKKGNANGFQQYARKYTNLKCGFIIRYADDFKIMCKTYDEAQRYYHAVVDFLKTRLKLDVNQEKSRVINLKKNSSDFLGFKIKVVPKGKTKYGYVAKTDMRDKAIKKVKINLKKKLKKLQKCTFIKDIHDYNTTVLGIHNYYRYATNVYRNMHRINYDLLRTMKICLNDRAKIIKFGETTPEFQKRVKGIRKNTKIYKVKNIFIFPISGVQHKNPMNFSQTTGNFTVKAREGIHKMLHTSLKKGFDFFSNNIDSNSSIEFNDNRISRYSQQTGKCYVTNKIIEEEKIQCYRKIPLDLGGTDSYMNLVIINKDVSDLLNETNANIIEQLILRLKIKETMMEKINKLRILASKPIITYSFT